MNAMKKRKIRIFFKKYKALIISFGVFGFLGLVALLIGFEIANDWHAIRNWLSSPYALTFLICSIVGLFLLIMIILVCVMIKKGDE